uniref:Uncharacterized protein n=1 Tax=Arundo donax TaxID=35708 RepID=A0A0A9EVN4_ARUDO
MFSFVAMSTDDVFPVNESSYIHTCVMSCTDTST